jgi:hypothetical protein
MGQDRSTCPLTSSYSSLQGTNQYSAGSVIQGPHGGVTFTSFLLTKWSQFHPFSTCIVILPYLLFSQNVHERAACRSLVPIMPIAFLSQCTTRLDTRYFTFSLLFQEAAREYDRRLVMKV